jgi:hypothetical protein
VCVVIDSASAISGFASPPVDQREHIGLPLGEVVSRQSPLPRRMRADEGLDQPGQESGRAGFLSSMHPADGVGGLAGVGVLEQERTGPGPDCSVDVLVELEHRQHDDPSTGEIRIFSYVFGGCQAVALGHADVHEDNVRMQGADLLEGLDAVAGLSHALEVVLEVDDDAHAQGRLRLGKALNGVRR